MFKFKTSTEIAVMMHEKLKTTHERCVQKQNMENGIPEILDFDPSFFTKLTEKQEKT